MASSLRHMSWRNGSRCRKRNPSHSRRGAPKQQAKAAAGRRRSSRAWQRLQRKWKTMAIGTMVRSLRESWRTTTRKRTSFEVRARPRQLTLANDARPRRNRRHPQARAPSISIQPNLRVRKNLWRARLFRCRHLPHCRRGRKAVERFARQLLRLLRHQGRRRGHHSPNEICHGSRRSIYGATLKRLRHQEHCNGASPAVLCPGSPSKGRGV